MNNIDKYLLEQNEIFGNEVEDKIGIELDDIDEMRSLVAANDASKMEIKEQLSNFKVAPSASSDKIFSSVIALQVETVIEYLKNGFYVIPGYQRRFVWTKEQVTSLVFSLIRRVPIPAIYLYDDENSRNILDGQQRVTAFFLYRYGLFFANESKRGKLNFADIAEKKEAIDNIDVDKRSTKKEENEARKARKQLCEYLRKEYGLVETEFEIRIGEEVESLSYYKFSENVKRYLMSTAIETVLIRCTSERPQYVYADIFKIMNTGGKTLGSQEIRNGIYWKSSLYKNLQKMNSNENWRRIYGAESIYSKDIELLLKMLALNYYTMPNGDGDIDVTYDGTFNWSNIMDGYSEASLSFSPEVLKHELMMLKNYLDGINFDDDTSKCNKGAFEALFVSMAKRGMLEAKVSISMKEIHVLEKQKQFEKVLSNKKSVCNRLSKTYKGLSK